MTDLKNSLETLRGFFQDDVVITEPTESTQNFEFKRLLLAKAKEIIISCDNAAENSAPNLNSYKDITFYSAQELLANDPELEEFSRIAGACEDVVSAAHELNT
jgi:hypothetical protein